MRGVKVKVKLGAGNMFPSCCQIVFHRFQDAKDVDNISATLRQIANNVEAIAEVEAEE